MRILVVEDSDEVREYLARVLAGDGHVVDTVATYDEGARRIATGGYALYILDWMLPEASGIELCRAARAAGDATPILILTARGDVEDRVTGLDSGADDYLRKPFAADELRARVRALLRRGPRLDDPVLTVGDVEVRSAERRAVAAGRELVLTSREFDILETLARGRGRVVLRGHLLLSVWGTEDEGAAASLEVLVARLRRKLSLRSARTVIRTHRGLGYALEATDGQGHPR